MTKIKFERIISYSSEHPNHKAENLLSELPSSSGSKKVSNLLIILDVSGTKFSNFTNNGTSEHLPKYSLFRKLL